MRRARAIPVALALAVLAASSTTASSQGLGALRKKAEEAKKKVETAVDKKPTVDSAKAKAGTPAATPGAQPDAAAAAPAGAGAAAPAKAEAKVWENYDFIPGNKVLFYTDFTEDKVGNFARRLKYVAGPIEIVERDGAKVLRSTGRSTFLIPLAKQLPQRFTLEIDIIAPTASCCGYEMLTFEGGETLDRSPESGNPNWHSKGTLIIGGGRNIGNSSVDFPDAVQQQLRGNLAHVRVLMDSAYFKMYTNERRSYNIPEFKFKRDTVIRIFVNGDNDAPVFLTNIRVAESETDVLYDALAAKGRWATQGILFATGKAELRPESRSVLKEIASMMKDHADLKILIEGHTDNVGASASNLTLSDARAAAVKAALVSEFGVGGDRMTTKGLGDTKPSAPNTSPEGRAQNRRVEIVKQ